MWLVDSRLLMIGRVILSIGYRASKFSLPILMNKERKLPQRIKRPVIESSQFLEHFGSAVG